MAYERNRERKGVPKANQGTVDQQVFDNSPVGLLALILRHDVWDYPLVELRVPMPLVLFPPPVSPRQPGLLVVVQVFVRDIAPVIFRAQGNHLPLVL